LTHTCKSCGSRVGNRSGSTDGLSSRSTAEERSGTISRESIAGENTRSTAKDSSETQLAKVLEAQV